MQGCNPPAIARPPEADASKRPATREPAFYFILELVQDHLHHGLHVDHHQDQ